MYEVCHDMYPGKVKRLQPIRCTDCLMPLANCISRQQSWNSTVSWSGPNSIQEPSQTIISLRGGGTSPQRRYKPLSSPSTTSHQSIEALLRPTSARLNRDSLLQIISFRSHLKLSKRLPLADKSLAAKRKIHEQVSTRL